MPRTEQIIAAAVQMDLALQTQLRSDLAALADIRAQSAELKAAEAAIAVGIEDIRAQIGEKTLAFEGAKITRIEPKDRAKLDEGQLIRRFGLTVDDVQSLKKFTPVKPSTRITLAGEKETEEY